MRILHVFKVYYPDSQGGIEQVIHQLATAAAPLGVESTILCLSKTPQPTPFTHGAVRVAQTKTLLEKASTPVGVEIFRAFGRLAREHDVVHYHFPYPWQDLVHLAHRALAPKSEHRPSVVTYHSDIIRQKRLKAVYKPLVMQRFLSSVDVIVATSENYLRTSGTLQRFREKVRVIPIGIDPSAYPAPSPERTAFWRERMGGPFFLFIGVLRYYKGLDILLEAANRSPLPIVIAGAGPYEPHLKAKTQALGLTNVTFLGHVDEADKMSLLASCHGVVFPSHLRSEAFGVTLLEGAMMGKPLISTEIGTGTSFVNEHGVTGVTIAPSNPDALADAMRLLATDEPLAARYGVNARQRFERFFTAETMAADYAALWREVADRSED